MEKITIIIPVHNEADIITRTIFAINQIFADLQYTPEFIVVDDGSTDDTLDILAELTQSTPHLRVIALSRNFGKEQAILAGIEKTDTAAAIIIDADLQHPPEVIPDLIKTWNTTNADVVHAVKKGRKNESVTQPFLVNAFYRLHKLTTGTHLKGASDFKLLNRKVMSVYASLKEQDIFFRGLIPWVGFKQETVHFEVAKRDGGNTKWTPLKRAITGIKAITAFSTLPLHLVTLTGICFLFGATLMIIYTLYQWWTGVAVEGFTTVIILLLIIGSIIMISLGIIGQYIAQIYSEVKARPRYIIKDKFNFYD
jgi:polyisoprenyl-phosphate glycosyltransferase